jgi:hypothetical protein
MTLKFAFIPLIAAAVFSFSQKETKTTVNELKTVVKRSPGIPTVTNFMVGQTIVGGTITVVDDVAAGTLKVTYQLNNGWYLKDANLYVGTLAGIPKGNSGNPRPGQFPYKSSFASGTQTWSVTIPLASLPPDFFSVAAHATVTGPSNQTGWGQGPQINDGGSWAMQFEHSISPQ